MRSLLLAVFLLAQISTPAPRPAGQTGTITGRLLALDGTPAAGVRVSATPAPEPGKPPGTTNSEVPVLTSLTLTDAAGRFRLENLPPGRYDVLAGFVDFPTYYPGVTSMTAATAVSVTALATAGGIDFQAARSSTGLTLRGRLKRDTNEGVGGVNISLYGNDQYPYTRSLSDGSFEFSKLRPGTYSLSVAIPGFQSQQPQQIVFKDKDITGMEVVIPWTVDVKGTVSVEGGGLRPNFTLTFVGGTRGSSTTSARESFQTTLNEGAYAVAANGLPSGFFIKSITSGSLDLQKDPLILSRAATPAPVIVTLGVSSPAPWVKLSGRVVGLPNPRTADARIALNGVFAENLDAVIAADGSFEFPKLLPGTYSVNIRPTPVSIPGIAITVPNSDLNGVVLAVPAAREVSGRIDVEDGGPFPRTSLNLTGTFGMTLETTPPTLAQLLVGSSQPRNSMAVNLNIQPDGTFKANLPEGKYQITASPQIRSSSGNDVYVVKAFTYGSSDLIRDPVSVTASDSASLNLMFGPPSPVTWSKVTGKVTGVDASILEATPLTVTLNASGLLINWTSPVKPDGSFEFPKLYPGTYTARIAQPNGAAINRNITNLNFSMATATINLAGSDIAGLEIGVPHQKEITGKVTLEGRGPMPRITIPLASPTATSVVQVPYMNINPQTDGSFKVTVLEGERQVGVATNLPAGYAVKSLTYGTTDLLKNPLKILTSDDAELHVTLTTPNLAPVRISGKLTGLEDAVFARGLVTVALNGSSGATNPTVSVSPNGTFQFSEVFPGSYTLRVSAAGIVSSPTLSVNVGSTDVVNIEIAVPRQKEINGRVVLEGRGVIPGITIPLSVPGDASNSTQTIFTSINPQADGTFKVTIQEGERVVGAALNLPAGYAVKSLMYGTTDLLMTPWKVSVSDNAELRVILATPNLAPVRVSGKLTGDETVLARGPVTVTLNGGAVSELPSVIANTDRSFQFPEVFPGKYTIRAFGQGITSLNMPSASVVVARDDVSNVELAIPRQKEINGRVILEGRGAMPLITIPLSAQTVTPNAPTIYMSVNPQPDGSFKVTVPEGERLVGAVSMPAGFAAKSIMYGTTDLLKVPFKVSISDTTELRLTLTAPDIAPVRVSGKLTGVADTAFLRGPVTLLLFGTGNAMSIKATVNMDRSFEFLEVFPGKYEVHVNGSGISISPALSITVANTDLANFEIAVPGQREIGGRVILEGRGAMPRFQVEMPLAGEANVLGVSSTSGTSRVSQNINPQADGTFKVTLPLGEHPSAFTGLPSGYAITSATYGGIDVLKNRLKISESDNAELHVTLSTPDLSSVRVRGKLTGGDDPALLSGRITATLNGLGNSIALSVPVNADRTFEFPEVFPGNYVVRVNGSGILFLPAVPVTVAKADVTNLEIAIPRQKEISGRVILEGRGAVPRFQIQMQLSAPASGLGSSSASLGVIPQGDGTFKMNLPVGERSIAVVGLPSGYTVKSATYGSIDILKSPLKISESDSGEFRVTLKTPDIASVRVSGKLSGMDEAAFARGPVTATLMGASNQTPLSVPIQADGSFQFAEVFSGAYTLRAAGPGIAGSPSIAVTVAAADIANLEIAIPRQKEISGRVFLEGSGPMPRIMLPFIPASGRPVPSVGGLAPVIVSVAGLLPGVGLPLGVAGLPPGLVNGPVSGTAITPQPDGTFRITLPAGEQRVGPITGLPPGYTLKSLKYGTTDLLTNPLKVAASDTDEMQVTLTTSNPTPVRVSGHIAGLNEASFARGPVNAAMTNNAYAATLNATVRADGTFEFPAVYPGAFVLRAVGASVLSSPNLTVNVAAADIHDIEIQVPTLKDIAGHIVIEGGGPYPMFALPIGAVPSFPGGPGPASGTLPAFRPDADGAFHIGLPVGESRASSFVGLPPGYTVKTFTYGSTDLLKNPLRITAADSAELQMILVNSATPVKVSGRITGVELSSLSAVPVRITLQGASFVAPLTADVRADGTFEIPRVYPGNYRVSALKLGASTTPVLSPLVVGDKEVTGLVVAVSK